MLASLYFNRDRSFSIFPSRDLRRDDASESLIKSNEYEGSRSSSRSTSPDRPKDSVDIQRDVSPAPWSSESSSPTSMNFPSRILQKFPFLVEMFYWALNYVAYAFTKQIGIALYSRMGGDEVAELAQKHGIDILTFEHDTPFQIFFPITEVGFQQFFLNGHLKMMTFFNQIYSLVHIPGTIAFLSWYYYTAPSHDLFAIARRTMTLGNFSAFVVFSFWPCMPPRLLPKSFGFRDTVRQDNAESVWVGGANVNQLAAMPSLHFTYAFIIGCTFLFQSGILQAIRGRRAPKSAIKSFIYIVAGVLYPLLVLSVIVATANHYWADAVAATLSVTVCFFINRLWLVLLPVERLFCRIVRLRKPTPTTAKSKMPERPRIVVDLA
ncbi:hypothetical protein PRZ48_013786 [Zasmidium cellare]|uniref:Inositolphosphotransferase Aur1/Ipt1 domain-containing protein n=1 Tax=Zasmidium cellare TaxID=395010 RepID=A0ABR0E222_ZASCE|nr:hypothetical protein PRZ48_013786 [Zasmidium cellare]